MTQYILGIDEGTTSARTLIFDEKCEVRAVAQREITQISPNSGWTEHDPLDILTAQLEPIRTAPRPPALDPHPSPRAPLPNPPLGRSARGR